MIVLLYSLYSDSMYCTAFGVKIVLSGFTKDVQWISAEKSWTVIFVPDLIECAFVGVCLSDAKFMGGEYYNDSRNAIY